MDKPREAVTRAERVNGTAGHRLQVVDAVAADALEEAWRLYAEVFDSLRYAAVQRHVMFRDEFDAVMADSRVAKYVAVGHDGHLRGLSTYTNDLSAVPLISPEFFARRWPEHFATRRIWYCGFVAVRTGTRSSGVFAALVEAMYRVAATEHGIIALDFCRHNDEVFRMSRAVRLMLHRLSGGVLSRKIDEQAYWLYEFPTA
jgi:hypothetical protein